MRIISQRYDEVQCGEGSPQGSLLKNGGMEFTVASVGRYNYFKLIGLCEKPSFWVHQLLLTPDGSVSDDKGMGWEDGFSSFPHGYQQHE